MNVIELNRALRQLRLGGMRTARGLENCSRKESRPLPADANCARGDWRVMRFWP